MKHLVKEKILRKNSLKRFLKNAFVFCLCISGGLLILGTAGSSDLGFDVSLAEIFIKWLAGIALVVCGLVVDSCMEV